MAKNFHLRFDEYVLLGLLISCVIQGNFNPLWWSYCVIQTIFIGFILHNDDNQLYACPKALGRQTCPIVVTGVEAVRHDKVSTSIVEFELNNHG